ncbi:uncharacterized protein DMENIID0001_034400 [Sergentomyia squamirostris]
MDDGQEFFSEDEDFWQDWNEYEQDSQVYEKNEYFRIICYYCDRRFTSVKKRFQHEKVCNYGSTERFTCKVCKLNFRLEPGLERHKKRHDLPGGFSCLSCEEKFTESSQRLQHNITVHKSFNCQICKSTFSSQDDYVDHIIRNHSKYKCWLLEQKDEHEKSQNTKAMSILGKFEIDSDQDDILDLGMNGDPSDEQRKSPEIPAFAQFLTENSDDELPDIDEDMPLAKLKSQTKKPTATRKSPRKSKESVKKNRQSSDDSEDSDYLEKMENSSNPEANEESEYEEIRPRRRPGEPRVEKQPEFKCPHCPQIFIFEKRYMFHLKEQHGVEVEYRIQTRKKDVRKYSSSDRRYKNKHRCSKCTRRFSDKNAMKEHEELHGPDGRLRSKCNLCGEFFDNNSMLREHKKTTHKDEVTCNSCKKTYSNEQSLQHHIDLRHTKKITRRTLLCGKCGKNFTSKTALVDHERSDCGKNPIYPCDICKKNYRSAGSLKLHKTVHDPPGTEAFGCKYCEKRFRTKNHMLIHERVHTGEKPFVCTYCSKAFGHKETLLTHLSLHTGYKRFMCSGCGQRFSCISGLQSHRKAHADTCGRVPNCTKTVGPMGPMGFQGLLKNSQDQE